MLSDFKMTREKREIKKRKRRKISNLTAPLAAFLVLRLVYFDDLAVTEGVLEGVAAVEGLCGDDAVDFWGKEKEKTTR